MLRNAVFLFCFLIPMSVGAKMASVGYVTQSVNSATNTKVDTASTAKQTMAGSYTVSGTLVVPTPPLPSAK